MSIDTVSTRLLNDFRASQMPIKTPEDTIRDLKHKISDLRSKVSQLTAERDLLAGYIDNQQNND